MSRRFVPRCGLALFTLALSACGSEAPVALPPSGQVVLYVSTDAPLPPPAGEQLAAGDPAPLFDRLRIELFAPGQTQPCAGCSREFELDRRQISEGKASIGVVPRPGEGGYVARVRIFRGLTGQGREPPRVSTLETNVALPKSAKEGVTEVTVLLRVDDLGSPRGSLGSPSAPKLGKPDPASLAIWAGARRVPCRTAPRAGEACVPGGAYWMGNPAADLQQDGSEGGQTRLVVLKPFFVSLHETTVAEFRESGLEIRQTVNGHEHALDPAEGALSNAERTQHAETLLSTLDLQYFCDYSLAPGPGKASQEATALNCVSWYTARAYCASIGADLPTQAQFEYLDGGLVSNLYPWGNDATDLHCDDGAWTRGGVGPFHLVDANLGVCRVPGTVGGPAPPGTGKLDRLSLEGGDVVDLAGNVTEWVRDRWNRPSEPCWFGKSILKDPLCTEVSDEGDLRAEKGGMWAGEITNSAFGAGRAPDDTTPLTGFRCVRADN